MCGGLNEIVMFRESKTLTPNRDGGEGLGAEGSVQGGVLFHPLFG